VVGEAAGRGRRAGPRTGLGGQVTHRVIGTADLHPARQVLGDQVPAGVVDVGGDRVRRAVVRGGRRLGQGFRQAPGVVRGVAGVAVAVGHRRLVAVQVIAEAGRDRVGGRD